MLEKPLLQHDGLFDFIGRALRRIGYDRARRRIVNKAVICWSWIPPNAARIVLQLFGELATDGIGLCIVGMEIVAIRRYNVGNCVTVVIEIPRKNFVGWAWRLDAGLRCFSVDIAVLTSECVPYTS